MRFLFILLLASLPATGLTQAKYHCEYTAKVSFPFPDSLSQSIRAQLEEKGVPSSFIDKFVDGLIDKGLTSQYLRIVECAPDSTFIIVKMGEENEEDLKMNMPTHVLLFYEGEIYQYDSSRMGFFPRKDNEPQKVFVTNVETKAIKGHICKMYTSTDNNCTIWIAPDLPSYINPGIKIGNIKGAVLAFTLKSNGSINESEIDTIEEKKP